MLAYVLFVPVNLFKPRSAKIWPACHVLKDNYTLPQMLGRDLIPAVVSVAKRISRLQFVISVDGACTALQQVPQPPALQGRLEIVRS